MIKALRWIGGLLGLLLGAAGTVLWLRRKPSPSVADAKKEAVAASRRAAKTRQDSQDLAGLKTRQDRTETQEARNAGDDDLDDLLDSLDARARDRSKR